MPYRRRSIVLAEIVLQCRFALQAYADTASSVDRSDDASLWCAVEALLGAAAHLAQLLYPAAGAEAGELRSALGVDAGSPLARPELRAQADLAALVDQWTRHPNGAVRALDRERSLVRYYGLTFELAPLLAAIAEVETRAVNEARQMRQMV